MQRHEPDPARRHAAAYPFVREIPARFGDMDLQMHLNNVAIASYYEDARATMNMRLFGADLFARKRDFRFVVLESRIRYLHEAPYPGTYRVGVAVTRIGTSSCVYGMGLFIDDVCVGLCDTILVNMTDAGPTAIPDDRRARLAAHGLRADAARPTSQPAPNGR